MPCLTRINPQVRQKGFTLIEILVALVILSVGLLGVASLQVQGLRNNQSAYLRSQATLLAYDMADRLRANSALAIAGNYNDFDTLGDIPADPGCISDDNGCSAANQANTDMFEWAARVNGSNGAIALLPDAQGQVIRGDGNLFTIQILWTEKQWDNDAQSQALADQTFSVNLVL